MHAKKIRIDIDFDGNNRIAINYEIDELRKDVVNIILPYKVKLNNTHLSLLGLITSIILAKLCLAEEIILDFPISGEMVKSGIPLLELLYDARCYRDRIDIRPLPRININNELPFVAPIKSQNKCDPRHAQLLWSGGKDSTLSLLMLQANGYKVSGFHATINEATALIELESSKELGGLFSQDFDCINIDSRPFAQIGTRYSTTFGKYPKHNSIPQGRDFILFTLLAIISDSKNSNILCSGSEYELFSKTIEYQGKLIYRHDAQSQKGYELITNFLSQWYQHGFQVFSPVSPLTEYRTFKILSAVAPKSFDFISSCFWGDWCGECLKCFRYALIQKNLQVDLIKFKRDPLASNSFFDLYINEWGNENMTYREEIYYCLNTLSAHKKLVETYDKLAFYTKELFPQSSLYSNQYYEYLLKTHPVKTLPKMFNPDLLG